MGTSLLVEFYNELPEERKAEDTEKQVARLQGALDKFKKKVVGRYSEGTLHRLLDSPSTTARRAAVLGLGLMGTMRSNAMVAKRLGDDDQAVRQMAADALWALWFRADSNANNAELQRLIRLRDYDRAIAGLDLLITRAPKFAEAYNQRAIAYFRKKEYQKSALDCEKAFELNPCHFGAMAGQAQCFLKLNKPRAALMAFRQAFRVNPGMSEVEDAIRTLENSCGEEGKKDDKK